MTEQIERAYGAMERISLLAQLRDKVIEASDIDRKRCGVCHFWMASRSCPRERNVNGYSRGPNCDDLICSKFKMKPWVTTLKAERMSEAASFAERHGLPGPVGSGQGSGK